MIVNQSEGVGRYASRLKKLTAKASWLSRPVALVLLYALWVLGIRLLTLTFITFFTISPSSRFQDISDAFSSNEVSLMGLSAVLFVGLQYWLNPLTSTTLEEIVTREDMEKRFLRGFSKGALVAGTIVISFVLLGIYRYLGYFILFNEAPLELANVLLRMGALVGLAYCEEFIFRHQLLRHFQKRVPLWAAANFTALFYCFVKMLQFDLGIMHLMTLYLVSLALYFRAEREGRFTRGAGFWAAILIIFHPVLSLPIFGNNFSGVLLVKYQPAQVVALMPDGSSSIIRFLTGGIGGPIASFIFQLLLILDIGRSIVKQSRNKS